MTFADHLRITYETAMGVPNPAPWSQLAESWQDVWRKIAREASEPDRPSRRDLFAAAALGGLLGAPEESSWTYQKLVEHVDLTIAELDEPRGDPGIRVVPEVEQKLRAALTSIANLDPNQFHTGMTAVGIARKAVP